MGLIEIIEIIVIVNFLQLFRSGELSEACVPSGGAQREWSERVERDYQRAAEGGRGVLQTGSDPDSELRSKKGPSWNGRHSTGKTGKITLTDAFQVPLR